MGILKIGKNNEEIYMRWYDIEPDVFMAISMIECSSFGKQIEYANYIIKQVKEKDPDMEYIKNTTMDNIRNIDNRTFQRWYDKDETISTAFEYLKNTTSNIQKEIALDVLSYMNIQTAARA